MNQHVIILVLSVLVLLLSVHITRKSSENFSTLITSMTPQEIQAAAQQPACNQALKAYYDQPDIQQRFMNLNAATVSALVDVDNSCGSQFPVDFAMPNNRMNSALGGTHHNKYK
jgi:hypothetical protein